MPPRVFTLATLVLGLLLAAWPVPAREVQSRAVRRWLSDLVTRVDAAARAARQPGSARHAGTAVIRLEVTADGSVRQAGIEDSSGRPDLDERALRAVRDVGPLPAPPPDLLDLSGIADLSIPVELGR